MRLFDFNITIHAHTDSKQTPEFKTVAGQGDTILSASFERTGSYEEEIRYVVNRLVTKFLQDFKFISEKEKNGPTERQTWKGGRLE